MVNVFFFWQGEVSAVCDSVYVLVVSGRGNRQKYLGIKFVPRITLPRPSKARSKLRDTYSKVPRYIL